MNYDTYELVHGLRDRLLYLNDQDREEFLKYIDALFHLYPLERVVRYGSDIAKQHQQKDG